MGPLSPSSVLAAELGVSEEAVSLARTLDIVDMHVDTFIPVRLWSYDVRRRHGRGWLFGHGFGHFDVPRALDGGVSGAMWSITTNPFRTARGRWQTFLKNLTRLREIAEASSGHLAVTRSLAEYRAARRRGAMACMPAVQGANCMDDALRGPHDVPDRLLTRATLVHLTNSRLGGTSGPWGRLRRHRGLTARGRALVSQLDECRVFVDLAHAHPETFWDAVDAHDPGLPLLVTHTGVKGVYPSWRNIDDAQIRAVAETGGVVGIIYASYFLVPKGAKDHGRRVIDHMNHVIDVAGEEHVGLGTDYDGFIVPPRDLRSADSYPRLVQYMLDAGWSERRIDRVLGANFLRAFGELRPE